MKMRALKPFRYGGRPYRKGDEVEMRNGDAKTMRRIGKVEPAAQPTTRTATGRYRRRDMVAEAPPPAPPPENPFTSEQTDEPKRSKFTGED